jgi:hypothetical protein
MMVIQHAQMAAFKEASLNKFEGEMVAHLKKYFPSHFNMIGENGIRNAVKYGYKNAKNYGFTSKRNVCQYLNTMILLGSNFDTDPQYPWVKDILAEAGKGANACSDQLMDATLEYVRAITGTQHIHLNRALLYLHHNADAVFDALMNKSYKGYLYFLEKLYPKKYEVVGLDNINGMIRMGKVNAYKYNLRSEPEMLLYVVLMFIMGSGFDSDPQFPWAKNILDDNSIQDAEKPALLFGRAIEQLRSFVTNINL